MPSATRCRDSPSCAADRRRTRYLHRVDPRGPRPPSRRVADHFVAIDGRLRLHDRPGPQPDMTEVIGHDDLLAPILAPSPTDVPPPSAVHRSGWALNPHPLEHEALATIPEHTICLRVPRSDSVNVAMDTLRMSRWTFRACRGGPFAHVAVDVPCMSWWTCRARCGGRTCTSRWIRRNHGDGQQVARIGWNRLCGSRVQL